MNLSPFLIQSGLGSIAMTYDSFFWYVFPWVVACAAFGWIAYDRYKSHNNHMHPGE